MLGSKNGLDLVTMMLLMGSLPEKDLKEMEAEFDKIYKDHIQEQKDKKARVADVKEMMKQEDKEKVAKKEEVVKDWTLDELKVINIANLKEIEALKKKIDDANKRVARRDVKIQELEAKNANIKCSLAALLVQM